MSRLYFPIITGTEEGFTPNETLFYGSTHEKDNFPGSGPDPSPLVGELAENAIDRRIVNRTLPRGPLSVLEFHIKWYITSFHLIRFPDIV